MPEIAFKKNIQHFVHDQQFIRFLLVGVLNTVIGYSLFVLFSFLGLDAPYALAFTYVFGVISNFFTTGKLVFGISKRKYFLRFVLAYVAVYLVNLVFLSILIWAGMDKLISQAVLVPFMALISFWSFKMYAFREA